VATVTVPLVIQDDGDVEVDEINGFFSVNGRLVSSRTPWNGAVIDSVARLAYHYLYIYDGNDFSVVDISPNAPVTNIDTAGGASYIAAIGPSLDRNSF
jgi:hypothetical protein